ncbi:uncharacterized protein [Halyomorpha halys]
MKKSKDKKKSKERRDLRESLCERSRDLGKRMEVSPLAKIRSLIRKLNEKKNWLGDVLMELSDGKGSTSEQLIDLEEHLLNIDEKLMLMIRTSSRKESDLKKLARKLSYMEPFHQYSRSVIKKLVKNSNIIGFEAGRVLYDEGDEPLGAYFILSGEVQVGPDERIHPVQRLLETINRGELHECVQELKKEVHGRGILIGMNEIFFGEARPCRTIVTKNVLLIHFQRKDVMRTFLPMINQWHNTFQYLTEFEIFNYFEFEATRELSTIGKVKKYQACSLIDATDTSCFLLEGQVMVIQRLLVENTLNNRKHYNKKLYHDQNALEYGNNVDSIYMQVCLLNKGSYFGIGERISKNKIWTTCSCRVLYFSKDRLLKYGSPELWDVIRARLDTFYPSESEVFKFFQYGRNWLKYKKDLSSQLLRGRGLSTIHDVPITLRSQHMKLKRSFIKNVKLTEMPDYLLGGSDPFANEIANAIVLDEGGPLREKMFGRLKTNLHDEDESDDEKGNTIEGSISTGLPME